MERAVNDLFEYFDFDFEYLEPPAVLRRSSEFFGPNTLIPQELRKSINELCKEEKIAENFSGKSLRELVQWFRSLKVETPGRKKAIGDKIKGATVQCFIQDPLKTESEGSKDKDSEGLEFVANDLYVENLDQAVEQITRFFTSKIRYLGPLRADPQTPQGYAPSNELDDVGAKGEYAAAVYDANQKARIEWYNPLSEQVERDTLKVALDSWARYLGTSEN